MAVAVLFTAPDVGATANPPPVKRELKALTKAKPQTVQKNETKATPPDVEISEQNESQVSPPASPAPYDPGWQFMATRLFNFCAQNLASLPRHNSGCFISALPPEPEFSKVCNPPDNKI